MNSTTSWLVRDSRGKIFGPYSLEKLIELADSLVITEDVEVSTYPNGAWQPASSVGELYNIFLQKLSEGFVEISYEEKTKIFENSKIDIHSDKEKKNKKEKEPEEDSDADKDTVAPIEKTLVVMGRSEFSGEDWKPKTDVPPFQPRTKTTIGRKQSYSEEPQVILSTEKKQTGKNTYNRAFFVLIAVMLAVAVYWIQMPNKAKLNERIHLVAPNEKSVKKSISADQAQQKIKKILANFEVSNFQNLNLSMNSLVALIESSPQQIDAYSLLCLTYYELWPYAYGDSRDLSVVNKVNQKLAKLDSSQKHSSACKVIQLIVGGKFESANQVIEGELRKSSFAPYLYKIKADLLGKNEEYSLALSYLQQVEKLWPNWLLTYIEQAKYLYKTKQASEAAKQLQNVLRRYSKHEVAALQMAEINYFFFQDPNKSKEYLSITEREEARFPRNLLARKNYLQAMLLQDSDPKQAHAFAKEAFELNPQEMLYRSLLVKLGGASSVENITRSDDVLEANGDFYWSNREYFAAQAEYSVAYKLNPKNAQAAFKAGRSMWELNFSKEAIEWMQKSIKADPKFIEAYVTLAEYYTQVFDFQAAFNSLSRAQALAKNDYRIFRGICEMELARNNLVSALNSSKAAVSLYDADVDTYLCMSQAFLKQNQLIDAYRASVQAVTYEPTNIEAQALYAEVLARYSGKEIGVQYITNLINTYPSVLEYRLSLARIFNHLENYSESRSVLQQVVDSEIRNKKIFLELAKIYQKQNDLQNALKYYLAAAELDPRDPAIIVAIGTLYLDSRKAADAAIQFEKASQRNPMYPNIYFLTAKAYYIAGDLSRAQQEAKKEMQRNPKIADSYLLLADIAMDNKNYLEASGLYRQAIELRPQSANIYVRLAKTHRLLGNYDVANQMLSLAAQKESGLPDIYKEMGALFETQSKAAEAIEAYRKYLILAPNASDRALINAIISKMGG